MAPGHLRTRRDPSIETDAINDSETDTGRRMSGEMISMRDFLAANKVRAAGLEQAVAVTFHMFNIITHVIARKIVSY